MDAIFNATTLQMGGALQVAVNLLAQSVADSDIRWTYLVSPAVNEEIGNLGVEIPVGRLFVLPESPSRSKEARRRIIEITEGVNPKAVLTVFGPAYVKFEHPHLMGIADGWTTHANWTAYARIGSIKEALRRLLVSTYRGIWARRANAWIVEVESAREGLVSRWRLPRNKIALVANNCGIGFVRFPFRPVPVESEREFRVLTMAAYYPHKNLELIPKVASWLSKNGEQGRFRFAVTLDPSSYGWAMLNAEISRAHVEGAIQNIGQIPISDGPKTYDNCDIMFLPSLLETFSASYPEAMAAGRPIVTSDLPFARAICGDAAIYFRPNDPVAAAKALLAVASSSSLRADLVERGRLRMRSFPTPESKYEQYKDCLIECAMAKPGA